MRIEDEKGLMKLPEGTENLIEVTCLHRMLDLVGSVRRLHRALSDGGTLIISGPTGPECWNDPRAKREIHAEAFEAFNRHSEDMELPHFLLVIPSPGQIRMVK
jgi:hypothetical protein